MRSLIAGTQAASKPVIIRIGSRAIVRTGVESHTIWEVSVGELLVLCSFLMAIAGCSSSTRSLQVFAAAGAKPAFDEAVRRFQQERGNGIEISYGGGGEVLARMVFAERGDVYVAPEQRFMKSAVEQRAVDPATIRDIAYMVPVLAVQRGNPRRVASVSDLARPGMRVAVTRSKTTCLGEYAPEIFRRVGLEEEIVKNVVAQAPRPDLLITWLLLGDADAVITWHFYRDLAPDETEVIWLPPEQLPGIGKMQAAVATFSKNQDLARRFVDFLASADGQAVFGKHGYIVDDRELAKHWRSSGPGPRAEPGLAGHKPPADRETNTKGPESVPAPRAILTSHCSLEGICPDQPGRSPWGMSKD